MRSPKQMTETERLQRHEVVLRDSLSQQAHTLRDWVRMLAVLGTEPNDILDLITRLEEDIDRIKNEMRVHGYPR